MTSKIGVNHDLRRNNGRTIYMPAWFQGETGWGNLELPNVYKADSSAKFPAGTKYEEGERIFYYAKYLGKIQSSNWQTALQPPANVAMTVGQGRILFCHAFQRDMADGLMVRHTADELSIVFQTTPTVMKAADYWSGGWVNGTDTGASYRPFYRYITKHDYAATGSKAQQIWNDSTKAFTSVDLSSYSDVSVLELDQAIITSKTTMPVTIMPNQWKHAMYKAHDETLQFAPALGAAVPNAVSQNEYAWLQTWGPMGLPWVYTEFAGAATGEVLYKISGDGSINPQHSGAPDPADGSTWQLAGISMASSIMETAASVSTGTDEERILIYLMIRR